MKKIILSGVALISLFCFASVSYAEVSSSSQTIITHTLFLGTKGAEVSALQQILKNKGFFTYPEITGYFGQITKDSVIAFQKANNISPIGIVGPLTRAKLYETSSLSIVIQPAPLVNHYVNPPSHPRDKIAPMVSITAPADDANVSGSIVFSADASDNRSVVGVQFQVDGSNVSTEDTEAPYSIIWNSLSTEDGDHTVTAIARDKAGNTTTSEPVTIHVDNTLALTVAKSGSGSGTVSSSPSGISCGATCEASFTLGTTVTLTAEASVGSTFVGWSGGGDCTGTGTCEITLYEDTSVTATFTLNTHTFTVAKSGSGTGTVTSTPAGIDCGSSCEAPFSYGTSVTLTASATAGSTFTGWSGGGCSGTGTCEVTVTADTTVTATFALTSYALTISKAGSGTGTVSSSPAGISCGGTCSASYVSGTVVTLTATADAFRRFSGWSGAGCGGTGTCVITMTTATSVTATFSPAP